MMPQTLERKCYRGVGAGKERSRSLGFGVQKVFRKQAVGKGMNVMALRQRM